MLIFKVASDFAELDDVLRQNEITVENIEPSNFSFLTSLRIATKIKRQQPDAILTFREKDAMAAISATEIQNSQKALRQKIILYLLNNNTPKKSINREVAQKLDILILETPEQLRNLTSVKNSELIGQKTVLPLPCIGNEFNFEKKLEGPITFLYIGPIGEGNELKRAIEKISAMAEKSRPKLIVAGTGKARVVMPLVKRARANKLNVEWLGDDYDLNALLPRVTAFVASGEALSSIEKQLLFNGLPIIKAECINKENIMSSDDAKKIYNELHEPKLFCHKLTALLNA